MWIRSQERKQLVNADAVFIRWIIEGYGILANDRLLGIYSTEEKAMKVMDMIDDAIIDYETMIHNEDGFFNERRIVFQMPTDSVVAAILSD